MDHKEVLAILVASLLAVVLLGGIYESLWMLNSVVSLIPYFLVAGIVGVLVWGFRSRVESKSSPPAPKLRRRRTERMNCSRRK